MALLPLDTWRAIFGYHPWFFWGWSDGNLLRMTSACNGLVRQYDWQSSGQAGRFDLVQAIENAEQAITRYVGYSVAPHYIVAENLKYPAYLDARLARAVPSDASGHWIGTQLSEGYVQAIGVESLTLLGTPTVSYSDADKDGIKESWVASMATSVTDASQIAVYVAAADRLDGEPASDRWRIQPVGVSISGGTLTLRGKAWLMAQPILYEGFAGSDSGLSPAVASNFLASVDVYQRTTDTTQACTLLWETAPYPGCTTPALTNSSDPAGISSMTGRAGIRDSRRGIVTAEPATLDPTSGLWSSTSWSSGFYRPPDRIQINYLAGLPLDPNGQMSRQWTSVVARLAAAELVRGVCACDQETSGNRELHRWQFDLARAAGANDEQYRISEGDLSNPLGTRAGQVAAWSQIVNERILVGFLPG